MRLSKVIHVMFAAVLITALTACVPAQQAGSEPTNIPTSNEAMLADAAEYAKQFGISQEEAVHRLSLQGEIGYLNAALQREQVETFAGLWLEHEPEFGVVVAFTRDGEQTIQPYLQGKSWADLVEVKEFTHSLQELKSAQQQAMQAAKELDVPISSGIDVKENRVTVVVGNPGLFLDEVRQAGLELPDVVDVAAIDPDRLTDTLRGGVDTYTGPAGETIYFPRQAPTNIYMAALLEGKLILDSDGCLRVGGEGGDPILIFWHHDFSLRVDEEVVEVLNGDGQVVARVGEPVRMGGGEAAVSAVPGLPGGVCAGLYWALGEIEHLEEGTDSQPTDAADILPTVREILLEVPDGLTVDEYELLKPPKIEPLVFVPVQGTQEDITEKYNQRNGQEVRYGSTSGELGEDTLTAREYFNEDYSDGWVAVERSDEEIYRITTGPTSPITALRGFWVFDGHWVLETVEVNERRQENNSITFDVTGNISQDGILLNEQFGYEEMFGFQLMEGKPFYFFKQDGKIHLSYDGKVVETGYDEVPHYRCCSGGALNPRVTSNSVAFFAIREDTWYYVVVGEL